jgi:3',5'-cyclic-AMP phosphodiesterase
MINSRKHFFYLGIVLFSAVFFAVVAFMLVQKKNGSVKLNAASEVSKDLSESKIENPDIPENTAEIKNENSSTLVEEKVENISANQGGEENKFAFGIIGDTQYFKAGNQNGGFQKAVKLLASKNVDLTMAIGDIVSSCDTDCESKLAGWKSAMGALYPKAYAMMGNHDRTGKDKSDAIWQKFFSFPTNGPAGYSELAYFFDFKNTHFVVLNSEKPDENIVNETQRAWLEQDLNANKKENVFVFFHEPAYPTNSKIGESLDAKPKERDALWNILSAHKVTAVFNGHEHIASRRNVGGIYQFVFGNTDSFNHLAPKPGMAEWSYVGQNFGVIEVEGKKITVNTYSTDGKLLDSFQLVK